MAVQVAWHNDKKSILVYTYTGSWNIDEFYITYNEGNVMMDEVDHPVHAIFDVSHSGPLPSGFISTLRSITSKPHGNLKHMFIAGANPFVQTFVNVFTKVIPPTSKGHQTFFVSTIDDAVTQLNKLKESS